jgi:hypothetical protein
MASIYGVSVKNVKCQTDHEGCAMYSADVWYNGKKLGHWSQDYWCGSCFAEFDKHLLDEAVEKYRKSSLVEDRYRDIINMNCLIKKVIGLKEDEKDYKKGLKNHYDTFVVQEHGFRQGFWIWNNGIDKIKKSSLYKDLEKSGHGSKILIYTSLKDFEVA